MRADGVFSGGGIKALAFAGALRAAADAGYTDWHQVAGTSAGAITAMSLAVGYAFGNRSIVIPTGDVPTLDFALTTEQKTFLYDSGYQAAKAFFDSKPKATNTYGAAPS